VLNGEAGLTDVIAKGHGGIHFIAGGSGLNTLLELKLSSLHKLYKQVLQLDKDYDYFIFDSGAGVNSTVLRLINSTDETILVTTTEPTSVMDAFVLIKSIVEKTRKPPVRIVMNRVENQMEGLGMSRNLKNIVIKYLDFEVNYLGSVSQDRNFIKSVKEQIPLMIRYPGCRAAKDIESIAYTFAQIAPPTFAGGLHRFFDKVLMGHDRHSAKK
jgi:flagellar biosynthesis protein FlhG